MSAHLIDSFVTIVCAKDGCGLVFQIHMSDVGKLESALCSNCEANEAIADEEKERVCVWDEANRQAPRWWR